MFSQYVRSASISIQGVLQATQELISTPSELVVRHMDCVTNFRSPSPSWAVLLRRPLGAAKIFCTGDIGQKYWHQDFPPNRNPTDIADKIVATRKSPKRRRSELTNKIRRVIPI